MSNEYEQTLTTLAAITAVFVKTCDDRNEGFEKLFLKNLESAFHVVSESCPSQTEAKSTLMRIQDILQLMEDHMR